MGRHHPNLLAGHFVIKKTCKLLIQKYYWLTLYHNIEIYVNACNVCLALKKFRQKPYGDLQLLPVPMHQWKHRLINFVTGLQISINWKKNSYNSILVIVYWLTEIPYYKLVKITIDPPGLAEVIINVVVYHHGLSNLIVTN